MAFDPSISQILQYATNFFSSGYAVVQIVIGIFIGGLVLKTLVDLVRSRSQ